ncbi:MAG: hypothetical protein IH899_20540 [Planctomycetes bacterium]|nr:hypothetical protein [Planctomycetota bacterium]
MGIQTAAFANHHWWFGCYGNKLLKTDKSFKLVGKYDFNCGVGIVGISGGKFLIGRGGGTGEQRMGRALVAGADDEKGLVIRAKLRNQKHKR